MVLEHDYEAENRLYQMGRIEGDRETINRLDDCILHEMPYISDYI